MDIDQTSLINLIKEAKTGNVSAFEEIYKGHSNYVYKVICDFFDQNILETEDLLQEVFLHAFQNLSTLKKEASFVSWLAGITLNVCKNYLRSKGYVKNKATFVSIDGYDIEENPKYQPSNILEDKYTRKVVLNAIDQLPSRQRLAMLLFYFHDYSYKDIAESFDITISGVKKLLHNGRNNIKETLRKKLGIEGNNYGFGFIFMEYEKNLLSKYYLPVSTVDNLWNNLKDKIKLKKTKLPIAGISAILLGLFLLFVLGTFPFQLNELPSAIEQTRKLPNKPELAIAKDIPIFSPIIKREVPFIQNTAYVNGSPTNTVALYFEDGEYGILGSNNDYFFWGLPKTGGSLLLLRALLLIGLGIGVYINKLKKMNIISEEVKPKKLQKSIKEEKGRKFMKRNQKRKSLYTAIIVMMVVGLLVTSLPINIMDLIAEEAQSKIEVEQQIPMFESGEQTDPEAEIEIKTEPEAEVETVPVTNILEVPQPSVIHEIQSSVGSITPASTVNGVTFNVSIAKSTDGSRPADTAFTDTDSINLANVNRYDMFYAYIKIDYKNNSGVDLSNSSITMQMPKAGEAGYYEVLTQPSVPGNWVAYPNTPTGDGNTNFPATNINTNMTSKLMTWTGVGKINDGSSGTVYVKIPLRDPFTKFGIVNYNPVFHFTKGGENLIINESASFNILGQNDMPSFTLTKIDDLGFIPTEPDADQYFYVKYKIDTPYLYTYGFPQRNYEYDRFLNGPAETINAASAFVNLPFPDNAELVSKPAFTSIINGNTLSFEAYHLKGGFFVFRYPKSIYEGNPTAEINLKGVFNGRYAGEDVLSNALGTESTYKHQIGTGSSIPIVEIGNIDTENKVFPISEDALKIGSVAFTRDASKLTRRLDTIRGDKLSFEFNGVEFLKNGTSIPSDYGVTSILLVAAKWTGNIDVNNPMSGNITVYFDDGSSEVIQSFTESNIINSNGSTLYRGNVTGVYGGYLPPAGKIAKKVFFEFYNVPQGFSIYPYVNGYVTGYPEEGADYLRILRKTTLTGTDPISGSNLVAVGSGDTSIDVEIAKNTKFVPSFTLERSSAGTVNPGQTDTIKLQSLFLDKSKQSFLNPEFDVLLPPGYSYEAYVDQTNETNIQDIRVFNLPDGRLKDNLPPKIETIPNYNGTGRMLVRLKYTGILQESEKLSGLLTIRAAQYMSPGFYQIDGYFSAENIGTTNNLSSLYTPYGVDTKDMNGNGMMDDYIFGAVSKNLTISRGVGTSLYSQMKGSFDPVLTGLGTTKQNTIVDGALTLEYNGASAMHNIRLTSVLPYEGDGKTLYGEVDDGQRVILSSAVDVSAYPGSTVYYNINSTNDPNAVGWTTIYSSDARAVRIDLPPAFALLNGVIEKLSIPLELQVPGTSDAAELKNVQGLGYLPVKVYSNMDVNGLDGASSIVSSLTLGLDIKVFKDDNSNGIKESNEGWMNNVIVDVFNLSDDITTATPIYSGKTNESGAISFLDGVNDVNFALQGYRVVVRMPSGSFNFVNGIGNVTSDAHGQQGVVFNTSNQFVNVLTAFAPQMMSISGNYWQDYEAVPNGMQDAHDLVSNTVGREVKLFNVTDGAYETTDVTIAADGSYTIPNVVIGPEYRVEFAYDSASEEPSVLAVLGGNMVTEEDTDILGYSFDSSGHADGFDYKVNAAMVENGTITVRFSTDGIDSIGPETDLTRSLPTTYIASIGDSEDITTDPTEGTFVVPDGYRLVTTELTEKSATIDSVSKTEEIVFLVELLETDLSGVKTSTPSSSDLHPGDTITYTITVTDSGSLEAVDTVVTDMVPEGTEFVSADQGGTVDADGKVSWLIDTIAEDGGVQAVSFTVKILAKKDLGEWDVVNDQAKVNDVLVNSTTDPVTQSVFTSKKVSDVGEGQYIKEGDTITYTISTTNTGASDSDLVTITDTIPEGTTFVEGSLSEGVTIDGRNLSINKDSLAPGETLTLSFKVTVNKGAKAIKHIDNVAKVNDVDTNKVIIPVDETKPVVGVIPKTGGYMLVGAAGLLGLLGAGLLIVSRRRRRQQTAVNK